MTLPETRLLAVFGATGKTGLALVAEARRRDWRVQALVRNPATSLEGQPGIEFVRGELSSSEAIEATLAGAQAVVCTFGPRPPLTEVFCAAATRSVIEAMRRHNVRRLIVQTGAMVGQNLPNWTPIWRLFIGLYQRQRPQGARDRLEQEALVRESGLDWTIIKPPRLTDGHASGRVHVGADLRVGLLSKVRRADVAVLLMDEVEHPRFVAEAVFIVG